MSGSSRASGRRRGSLPVQPNALVGRDGDIAALQGLLVAPETRLLTLSGPPGVGKTRLAVAAATAVLPHFADGVVFVDLTEVRDPALVPGAVLGALGLGEPRATDAPDHLGRALAGRALLVVLDNFEHVLEAGAVLAAALAASSRLRVLVTSRERLHLHAEREVPVHPLELPRAGDHDDLVAAAPAVAMLLQGVRAFDPGFDVTADNRAALVEICVRFDGLPLALELAAARLKLFTPGELTFRLRHRMSILTSSIRDVPDRHRTLRAALTWSHDLLSPDERAVFRRLSVFVGGATLDAAQHVCGLDDVVGVVASLVDKSLLHRRIRRGDVAQVVMLESLREYAGDLLVQHGEVESTRTRHARYFADLAARIESSIGDVEETAWVDAVGFDHGNLHAALAHGTAVADPALLLPLASALGWYCYTRGRLRDGQAAVDRAFAVVGPERPSGDLLAGALLAAAVLALARGDLDVAEELLGRMLVITQAGGDRRRTAIGTAFRGHLARARSCHDQAVDHHVRAGALFAELGNVPGVAWSRYDLGLLARRRGDDDGAAGHLREGLRSFRELRYAWAVGCSTWALASVEQRRGRCDEAAALLDESLDSFEATDDGRGLAQCLELAAAVACGRRRHRDTAVLLGAAAALRDRLGAPLPDEDRGDVDAVVRRARRELGADVADRARCIGRELSRSAAVALARGAATVTEPGRDRGGLTRRELQVADLVAGGRTNRQIGRALGITEKTAEVHVHNIIRKLDASSRAEVAAWVGARGRPT